MSNIIGVTFASGANPSPENIAAKSASTSVPTNRTAPSAIAIKAPIKSAKPLWTDLTPPQQQALAPLSSDWGKLDSFRKKKWLAIANKFPSMKPEEQHRVQERMREWAKLTPEQRHAARESYARSKKLPADQKSAEWQQYQNLPEEQKKKLAADAKRKNHLANLPRHVPSKAQTSASAGSKPLAEKSAAPNSQSVTPTSSPASTPSPTK